MWEGLPGEELISKGIDDLAAGENGTVEALLVAMARPKLRSLEVDVPRCADEVEDAELKLYALLGLTHEDAYNEYNALRRRLSRFEYALQARLGRKSHADDAKG